MQLVLVSFPERTRPVDFPTLKEPEVIDELEKSGEEPASPSSIQPVEDVETVPQQEEQQIHIQALSHCIQESDVSTDLEANVGGPVHGLA